MGGKGVYRNMVAFLEERGYSYDRKNSKGYEFWVRPGCRDISMTAGVDDRAAKRLQVMVQRDLGESTNRDRSKRDATAAKERQAGDRARAHAETARHTLIVEDLIAQRDRHLDGISAALSAAEIRAIVRRIEDEQRELRYWTALMTEVPRADAGRPKARHRS